MKTSILGFIKEIADMYQEHTIKENEFVGYFMNSQEYHSSDSFKDNLHSLYELMVKKYHLSAFSEFVNQVNKQFTPDEMTSVVQKFMQEHPHVYDHNTVPTVLNDMLSDERLIDLDAMANHNVENDDGSITVSIDLESILTNGLPHLMTYHDLKVKTIDNSTKFDQSSFYKIIGNFAVQTPLTPVIEKDLQNILGLDKGSDGSDELRDFLLSLGVVPSAIFFVGLNRFAPLNFQDMLANNKNRVKKMATSAILVDISHAVITKGDDFKINFGEVKQIPDYITYDRLYQLLKARFNKD